MKGFRLFFKLIFAVAFCIPLIIWATMAIDDIKCKKILKNGTEVSAEIVDYVSTVEVNGQPQYTITYVYLVNGVEHQGHTHSYFSSFALKDMTEIKVKYDEKFNSVESAYSGKLGVFNFLLIFGAVGIGFWVSIIVDIVKGGTEKAIKKLGSASQASFVDSGSAFTVNGVPYYFFRYQYKDDNGETKIGKTQCKYSSEEIEYFKGCKNFDIKQYKGKVAITEKIDVSKIYTTKELKSGEKDLKRCVYCDSIVSATDKKCPNCGANQFKEIK